MTVSFQDSDLATPPKTLVVGSETIGGVDYQQVKVVWGSTGTATTLTTSAGLPVQVTKQSSNIAVDVGSLPSVTLSSGTQVIGAVNQGASPWVTAITSGTVTLTSGTAALGSVTATLSSGTQVIGAVNQGTSPWVVSGSVNVTSGTVTLTSGTAALGSVTATLSSGTQTIGTVINSSGTQVIGSVLPSSRWDVSLSTAVTNTVAVSSGTVTLTSGTLNLGSVAVTSGTVTLTSGALALGTVTLSSGTQTIGTVLLTSGTVNVSSGTITLTSGTQVIGSVRASTIWTIADAYDVSTILSSGVAQTISYANATSSSSLITLVSTTTSKITVVLAAQFSVSTTSTVDANAQLTSSLGSTDKAYSGKFYFRGSLSPNTVVWPFNPIGWAQTTSSGNLTLQVSAAVQTMSATITYVSI